MTTGPNDEELLSRTARDPASFEPLVERHSTALHGYFARRALGAADDLLAELWPQDDEHVAGIGLAFARRRRPD
ncbi:hypothetical protein [Streptomyces sporangiiformans]|uniref:hypothetical protein n=1 Tax=Streptomyces sporangiiformans TaxID=2315329 RepID=UPI001F0926E2|nr:hypothetical protein [Streptomyces sporangiiformans]